MLDSKAEIASMVKSASPAQSSYKSCCRLPDTSGFKGAHARSKLHPPTEATAWLHAPYAVPSIPSHTFFRYTSICKVRPPSNCNLVTGSVSKGGGSTSRVMAVLRLMRNLCAGDEAISQQMAASGAHATASQLVIDPHFPTPGR